MSTQQFQIDPRLMVGTFMVMWGISLWQLGLSLGLLLVTLWFLLNFYIWFVTAWRRSIVEQRGPLLGIGYAFAAALVSSVVDGYGSGWETGTGLFFVRLIILALPFTVPFIVKPSPYPHYLDLAILAYALLLPNFPGFTEVWFQIPTVHGFQLKAGTVCMLGLLSTYFMGSRPWTGAPLDFKIRTGDFRHAAKTAGWALIGMTIASAISLFLRSPGDVSEGLIRVAQDVFGLGSGHTLSLITLSVGLVVIVETLVFRGLLQSGVTHWLPQNLSSGLKKNVNLLAALIAAAVHAALGVYGLDGLPALGFALGLTWAYRRSRRFFPAALGQTAALLLLAAVGAVLFYTRL